MPKEIKPKVSKKREGGDDRVSLYSQIMEDKMVGTSLKRSSKPADETGDESGNLSQLVDSKTSKKILQLIQEQQKQVREEESPSLLQDSRGVKQAAIDSDDDDEIRKWNSDSEDDFDEDDLGISKEDDYLIQSFMPLGKRQPTLFPKQEPEVPDYGLNPKVVEVYKKVGIIMSRYKSGPIPKTFKIIPTLRDWEQVLYITNPEAWTPHAMYQATRIFSSNFKEKMAQRFYSIFLLERLRRDISDTRKLNYHLYMAIKKSMFKPGAFFKGILLPLCESGTCTLREAAIIGSVLVKVSIPMLHSAAAILKLAEMNYSGPNSLFIRILLDKKYALPYKVIDAVVFHFIRFKHDSRIMPVLWHQSLLTFAQRYKNDLTDEQKEALLDLIKAKFHDFISPDVRRELMNSTCRGESVLEGEVKMMDA